MLVFSVRVGVIVICMFSVIGTAFVSVCYWYGNVIVSVTVSVSVSIIVIGIVIVSVIVIGIVLVLSLFVD